MLNRLLIQLMKLMILIDSIQTDIPRVVLVEIDSQAGAGYLLVLLVERVDCVGRGYFENFSSLAQNAVLYCVNQASHQATVNITHEWSSRHPSSGQECITCSWLIKLNDGPCNATSISSDPHATFH